MTSQCMKSPRHISQTMNTSGKLLNNTLVEKARAEEISVVRELGVWDMVDRPHDEVVFGTRWVDINKGEEHKLFCRSRLVVEVYKRQAEWSLFTATPPLEALRSLLTCATIDELTSELGQPAAWIEPVVLLLIDVRFVEFPAEGPALLGQSWSFAQ